MKKVILESPFAGDVEANIEYARRCIRDCLLRGESPYASHLLYTQKGILDDDVPEERKLGIEAGFEWRSGAELTVVYTDRGISGGMRQGIEDSDKRGIPVEYRSLEKENGQNIAGRQDETVRSERGDKTNSSPSGDRPD